MANNENNQVQRNRVQGSKKAIILRLAKYLFKHKFFVILAIVLSISSNIFSLLGPYLSGQAINGIEDGMKTVGQVNFEQVIFYCILMIVFYILSAGLGYALAIVMVKISQKVVYQMRKDVFDNLFRLPISFFDTRQPGDIISVISYDIDTVNASIAHDLVQIITSVITVVGSLLMMIYISPIMLVIFIVTVPASIIITRYMTKKVKPLFRKRSGKLGELNGFAEEIISGHKTIKAYNTEEKMIERFDASNEIAVDAYYQADYYGSMVGPTVTFINNISLALVSTLGAFLYLGSAILLGDVSSFVLYSRRFSGPINEFANIMNELQSAMAAAERVFRMIDAVPEKLDTENATELTNVKGDITIENVEFSYNEERKIISNLNLNVKAGTLVAIVGPTGAGKTTIINLLMRFYDPQKGTIKIDGKDITQVTRKSLRLAFAMVLQDTWLFNGTVFDNVAYGKENATMEEVVKACKAAKIHQYIMSLPDRYDTMISESGVNISAGQKQLLTIARAMLLDSHMLILDEATSNVDTQTEIKIQKAMTTLMEGKTSFVIAHRLSTIVNADVILVLKDGDVVEQGNHKELMAKDGVYSKLYNSQFE